MNRQLKIMVALIALLCLLVGCGGGDTSSLPESDAVDSSAVSGSDAANTTTGTDGEDTTTTDTDMTTDGTNVPSSSSATNGRTTSTTSKTTVNTTSSPSVNGLPTGKETLSLSYYNHPGPVEMDTYYDLTCLNDGVELGTKAVTLYTDNKAVTLDGFTVKVPYSVRKAGKAVNIVAVLKSDNTQIGKTQITFPWAFTGKTTFADEFDEVDPRVWEPQWFPDEDVSQWATGKGTALFPMTYDEEADLYLGHGIGSTWAQEYGCFSSYIDMPDQGWCDAAFWLKSYGSSVYRKEPTAGVSNAGEIDIIEFTPVWPDICTTALHYYAWQSKYMISDAQGTSVPGAQDGWHTYSCVWTDKAIFWYYDGKLVRVNDDPEAQGAGKMHVLLQMGRIPDQGEGKSTNIKDFPIDMEVDWVRCWGLTKKP